MTTIYICVYYLYTYIYIYIIHITTYLLWPIFKTAILSSNEACTTTSVQVPEFLHLPRSCLILDMLTPEEFCKGRLVDYPPSVWLPIYKIIYVISCWWNSGKTQESIATHWPSTSRLWFLPGTKYDHMWKSNWYVCMYVCNVM